MKCRCRIVEVVSPDVEDFNGVALEWDKKIEYCPLHAAAPAMLATLKSANQAINPPDKGGISFHEWNGRLKLVTTEIVEAIAQAEPTEVNQEKEREENEQP